MTPEKLLVQGADELGLSLSPEVLQQLLGYAALLQKWNRTYNLSAIRDARTTMTHHLLDSLAVVPYLEGGSLVDVGSGGGLPGIPIAIAQPQRAVVVNDTSAKRASFLRQARTEIEISNLQVHEGRVEQWRPETRFDAVISRGFAELAKFVAACRHLLAPGGRLLAMKGARPRDELSALPSDVDVREVHELRVPFLAAERHLVCMGLRAS